MKGDIGKSFAQFIDSTYEKMDGVLIQKCFSVTHGKDGYMWGGEWYESKEAIRAEIKKVSTNISLHIVNPNGETKKLGSEYTNMYFNGESPYNAYQQQKEVNNE